MSTMKKHLEEILFSDCLIEPFENQEGKIVGVTFNKLGIVYIVLYFLNGDYRIYEFFDFDIQIVKGTK